MSQTGKVKRTIIHELLVEKDQTLKERIAKFVNDVGLALFPDTLIYVVEREFNTWQVQEIGEIALSLTAKSLGVIE